MKMKKMCLLSVVFICSGFVFTQCNKDNGASGSSSISSINVIVENGSNYSFDNVKAIMYYGNSGDEYVVGQSKYTSGGFTVGLPETIDKTYLSPIVDTDDEGVPLDWVTISDKTVMGNGINIEGYQSGNYMGNFYYGSVSQNSTATSYSISVIEGLFVYAEKGVTMTGSTTETDVVDGINVPMNTSANIALKKGWNIIYTASSISMKADNNGNIISMSGTSSLTSTDPGGLKWYYQDDFGADILQMSSTQTSSALRSSHLDVTPKFSSDIQKIVLKHRLFQKSK